MSVKSKSSESLPKESKQYLENESLKSEEENCSQHELESKTTSLYNSIAEVVQFDYSFGYDCKQPFNLCVVDEVSLVFYSGTLIHIYNTDDRTLQFKKSFSGSGIGHIVKNPIENHIAIGEKCINPFIIVYDWPSFSIVSKLSSGTTYAYSHLGYSPDGEMLVSQGKEPDHLITIWNWKTEHIILRVKSHGQDVYNTEFSQFVPGQLTSCGLGHIKFWKMAKTFTGLKLQGELGRFGKTEICDILGICAMPDEKVVSGSEWGNLLVWEDRLIKLEVKQKAKGNCHTASISQIHFNAHTQDIISIGMDGWIKSWTRATIDTADPPDEEDWYLEMQPVIELHVKDYQGSAKLMSLCKKSSNDEDNNWFAQDGDGGIWSVNLSPEGPEPMRLLSYHAGEIADMAASPVGSFLATLGSNGCLQIHDVDSRELLISKRFKAPGKCLIWLPVHVEATGAVLVGGFGDGVLRMVVVSIREIQRAMQQSKSALSINGNINYLNIIQRVKAHTAPVTTVCLNPRGSIIVSGSDDKTIFIHQIMPKREYITLVPVGFVEFTAPINYVAWRPKQNATALVACADGSIVEILLPERAMSFTEASYSLCLDKQIVRFKSVKSELIREQELKDIEDKKNKKHEKKLAELAKIKTDNPNLDIDEDMFLMDSDEEIEFPPLYYPENPNSVLFVMILPSGNLCLSMSGYDCGYLYEYNFGTIGPVHSHSIPGALNTPIQCFLPICGGQLLVMGMSSGVIRLVHCVEGVPDLNVYHDIAMHDPEHGEVRQLCVSHDGHYLYSCGTDGSIFVYVVTCSILGEESILQKASSFKMSNAVSIYSITGTVPKEVVPDTDGMPEPSLEETKRDAENLHQLKLASERKESIRRKLTHLWLRFEHLLNRNFMLPESQRIIHSAFELDPQITTALENKIQAEMALMKRKMAFKWQRSLMLVKKLQNHFVDKIASLDVTVRAIKNEALRVKAFTHNKMTTEFLNAERELQLALDTRSFISHMTYDRSSRGAGSTMTVSRQSGLESMLKSTPYYCKLTLKGRKAIVKQTLMKIKKERRIHMWQIFLETKPDINADDPADVADFEKAVMTIGDFKLKSAATYKVPEDKRVTPMQKYNQIVHLHREIYELKEAFNRKVCHVRDKKISLVRRFKQLYHDLDNIQKQLSPKDKMERLLIPTCYLKNNFPEHIFRLEFGADPQIYQPLDSPYDEEYYVLEVKDNDPVSTDVSNLQTMMFEPRWTFEELMRVGTDNDVDTPWEHEMKVLRMLRLLHAQSMIIQEMRNGVNNFDDSLERLSIDRLTYARDVKLMEIFNLTLNQELVVINSYSGREDEISQRLNSSLHIRNEIFRQKITISDSIESKQSDIQMWQNNLSELQEEMTEKLVNNKFATFLNRVMKRKRVVKHSEDSESESSSSESSTDEEFEDDDNEDYIPIKLDENKCPDGCDPILYQDAITTRNQRYEIEDTITEIRRQLDEHQRELQIISKELIRLEKDVETITEEQEALQFEKQQKLNDIETAVVLSLSQFCHFITASHPEDGLVQNPLVFHSKVLTTLAGRVRDLEKETDNEKTKIKKLKALKQRLEKRRKDMIEIKKAIKKEIDEEIIRKFGKLIDVDQLEETVLKKMVSQARRDHEMGKIRKKFDKIIAEIKMKLSSKTEDLIQIEQENTRKVRLETMLEHEALNLRALLRQQAISKDKQITPVELETCNEDILQLEALLLDQINYGQRLKDEIRILSYKCTPPIETKIGKHISGKPDVSQALKIVTESYKPEETAEMLTGTEHVSKDEESTEDVLTQRESLGTIDKVLRSLAFGKPSHDIAVSLIEEMLQFTGNEKLRRSALEIALKIVAELIQITTKEDEGDITLVERCVGELLTLSSTAEKEMGSSVDLEHLKDLPEPDENKTDSF